MSGPVCHDCRSCVPCPAHDPGERVAVPLGPPLRFRGHVDAEPADVGLAQLVEIQAARIRELEAAIRDTLEPAARLARVAGR